MSKKFLIGVSVVTAMAMTGCASTRDGGGLTTRMYIEDRERVDQQMAADANQGYLVGTPKPDDRRDAKKTRKMFVLEFTKEPPGGSEVENIQIIERRTVTRTVEEPPPAPPRRRPEPRPAPVESEPMVEYVDYTIEKNDTLQKISKKFYDTYRKWPQIYEANKDVIKDPNNITPGVKIRIPTDKQSAPAMNLK